MGGESRKTVLVLPDVEAGALPDQGGHQVTCYTLQEAVPLTLEELLLKVNNGKRRENPKQSVVTHGCNSSVWEAKVGRLL